MASASDLQFGGLDLGWTSPSRTLSWASLYPEILAAIFQLINNTSWYCDKGYEVYSIWPRERRNLSHVCSYWYQVVHSTPMLWRKIMVSLPNHGEYQQFLWELQRTGRAPLHLIIFLGCNDGHDLLEFLDSELPRIERLSIEAEFSAPPVLPRCATPDAPILRHLGISVNRKPSLLLESHEFPGPFDPRALLPPTLPLSNLKSVRFDNCSYTSIAAYFRSTMKQLHLSNISTASHAQLLCALREMPRMEHLTLDSITFEADGQTPPEIVTLPHLRVLDLLAGSDEPSYNAAILKTIHFPSSATISITKTTYRGSQQRLGSIDTVESVLMGKIAGNGVLASLPVHTMSISSQPVYMDRHWTVLRLWHSLDDPRRLLRDPRQSSYLPSVFCTYRAFDTAPRNLAVMCELSPPHTFASLRNLHIAMLPYDLYHDEDNSVTANSRFARRFWDESFRCLTGIQELTVERVLLDGLAEPVVPSLYLEICAREWRSNLTDAVRCAGYQSARARAIDARTRLGPAPATLNNHGAFVLPRLQTLCIKDTTLDALDVDNLQDMLTVRREGGVGLLTLIFSSRPSEDRQDILRGCVDVLTFIGEDQPVRE
ncbi:hypothetical protein BXZ70DRAFT_735507 [Cristinia sonorae]|uniref:F-box domain-containing protein n=1 Tax=Cristinia sonorae TaxID=1940300 RepID=A0A8K0XSH8_9AGAR|nr:hypothetical protein BXZ70DRAFT_735507 [Cristinia sonorae]